MRPAKAALGFSLSLIIVRQYIIGCKPCLNNFLPYNYGMKKNPVGRPPKPPAERQTARLEIRMTDAELALIEKAAKDKTSTWARDVLVKAAKRAAQ
jgi:hypothetical protein